MNQWQGGLQGLSMYWSLASKTVVELFTTSGLWKIAIIFLTAPDQNILRTRLGNRDMVEFGWALKMEIQEHSGSTLSNKQTFLRDLIMTQTVGLKWSCRTLRGNMKASHKARKNGNMHAIWFLPYLSLNQLLSKKLIIWIVCGLPSLEWAVNYSLPLPHQVIDAHV